MKKRICKRIAFVMALVLTAVNVAMFPNDVQAADADAGQNVVYQQYTNKSDVEAYFGTAAPTYKAKDGIEDRYGYLFGGWFTAVDVDGVPKYKAIKNTEDLNAATTYYAKFVPAYILSVKCQNNFGTTSTTNKTEMRMVAGVDSTNYARVGFEIKGVTLDENGNLVKVGSNSIIGESKSNGKKHLWEKLVVYNAQDIYNKNTPKSVLGTAGNYFMGYRLSVSKANYGNAFAIRPFWETYDGVVVYGLTKYAHIEDGIKGYVNIPVNLKNTNKVAAGVVEFDWSDLKAAGYEYLSAECGKEFKTIKVNSMAGDSIIRCLVMTDITSENKGKDVASDDIYINLRFKQSTSVTPKAFDGTFYHFSIQKEDFSDMKENVYLDEAANLDEEFYQEKVGENGVNENIITPYDVWDIQY